MRGTLEYPQEVKRLRKLSLILVLAIAITMMLFTGVAYANFGPHGGYSADTDACAGCHRAHTSFSSVTWTSRFDPTDDDHSALLIGDATSMSEFCNSCHGDDAPGAATNVVSGVFDSGPSGSTSQTAGSLSDSTGVTDGGVQVELAYETNSTFNGGLNGGGFVRMPDPYAYIDVGTVDYTQYKLSTSMHNMDDAAGTDPMWGVGNAAAVVYDPLTCSDCHDVHGSSNYRILKDAVNGNTVGGYDASDNPLPYVVSAEENYPAGGWLKHEAGAVQMGNYRPNYTWPEYANQGPGANGFRDMSAWCGGCHERYTLMDDADVSTWSANWYPVGGSPVAGPDTQDYDYGAYESFGGFSVGARQRHRHPVNISISAGVGPARALETEVITSTFLPLEWDGLGSDADFRADGWDTNDFLGCLTCHRAHGASSDMTGWSEASLQTTDGTNWYPVRSNQPTVSGVNPSFSSALLRTDDRGVCERCHNK
jgi:hypothetical protein